MRLVGPANGTENRPQTVDKTVSVLQKKKSSKVSPLPKMTQIFILNHMSTSYYFWSKI